MDTFQYKTTNYRRYAQAGKWTLAIKEAEDIVQEFPKKPHGYVWLFQALGQQGEGEGAFMLADQAVTRFPNTPWVWTARAKLANQKLDWHLASENWQSCIRQFPDLIEAYVEGARANICNGNLTKAQELVDQGLTLSTADLPLFVVQAEIHEHMSEYQKANKAWALIRKNFPDKAAGYRRGVEVLNRLQDHLGALTVMINWIKSGNGALRNDYAIAVQALIRGFYDLNIEDPATVEFFEVLMAQPLAVENRSAVSELTRAVQSLSVKNNPKYQPITDYIKEKFKAEISVKGSVARMFALKVGIKELAVTDGEIAALISDCNQDNFCRYFSGYPLHVSNVLALKDYISRQHKAELLDGLSDDGLKNLHLFATAENEVHKPPFNSIAKRAAVPQVFKHSVAPLLNKNRLKIAVCVSGQLRGYKTAYNTWKRLGLEGHDTHFFVHCWRNIGRKTPDLTNAGRMFSGAFLLAFKDASETYGKAHIHAEYPALFAFFKTSDIAESGEVGQFYNTQSVVLEDDNTAEFADFSNPMKMFYKIQKSWELMQNSGINFDLIMRIRPDKTLVTKPPVDWAAIHDICASSPTVITDRPLRLNCHARLFVGDQFAIATPDAMAAYCSVFSNKKNGFGQDRKKSDFSDPHKRLAFTLYEAGLTTSQIPSISLGPLMDAEKLETSTILALIKEDVQTRQETALDKILQSALVADLGASHP